MKTLYFRCEDRARGSWLRFLCEPFGYGFLGHRLQRTTPDDAPVHVYLCRRCGAVRAVSCWEEEL